ncbi:AhpC-TSA-domain-containing protein [Aureobasidium sp. EXF-10727]|nr:AhpC-TSA-domain-containing protein [Aureobasidium sp. EXF-10727]
MVELRKRKTPPPAPAPAPKKERKTKATKANGKSETAAEPAAEPAAPEPSAAPAAAPELETKAASGTPKPGDKIDFDGFGGEIETNDGRKVTLKTLVDESKEGLVLFTYPKASTPGCTTQVCLFRDSYEPLTAAGLSIYGLSTDSPKANTTFKDKQKLPYPLLCDPSASLIGAIGLKKAPKGTTRGVFVVKKDGEVLAAEPGGPAATLEAVKGVVAKMGGSGVGEKAEARVAEAEKEESKGAGEAAAKL